MGKASRKGVRASVLLNRRRAQPALQRQTPQVLPSKVARNVIRTHHTLQKQLAQAQSNNDEEAVQRLCAAINANGGLDRYQLASINGQSLQRGGDSSKLLVQWLEEPLRANRQALGDLRLLEIGSLSPDNAISKTSGLNVTRIDLHSQHPSIETQDFMARPLPSNNAEKFDIISLSLVLNYAPDPAQRGEMLRRTTHFLRAGEHGGSALLPALFLVLPAPCVTNSRYLDEGHLEAIMRSLGYKLVKHKLSAKLIYGLWQLSDMGTMSTAIFKKVEVNPGKSRNNFAITIKC